ncbi:DUF3313 family protein [Poseidonibacter lekithochrous]|uniref:DUF3313 family protein n=1 Tax=Poseidonibacter lekithochrous TaxID=1904463 RepID=UPI0008FC80D8|nr:DUF3313 family protein [Poseidonibacter lekithochrous]QKJ23681.1 DUF3313 domain-containing protein [Poseidonibacter lekithochrous]
MKHYMTLASISLAGLLFTGCAIGNQPSSNSFIEDTSLLKPSPTKEGAYSYLKDGINFKDYREVRVSNIPIVKSDKKDETISNTTLDNVSSYFQSSLQYELNSALESNAGNKALTVDVAITSLGKEYKDLKLYQYIPVGLALTVIKRGVVGEDKNLVIQIAIKVRDASTNELVAMVVDSDVQKGFPADKRITLTDIKPSIDKWVSHYKSTLEKLINK